MQTAARPDVPAMERLVERARRGASWFARPLPVAFAGFGLAYIAFRIGSFNGIGDRVTDTPGYERVAALPLWSLDFYAGERGFTLPLLYKLFASTHGRIVAQLVISVASWLVLAAVAAGRARRDSLRVALFVCVLAFSLTTEITLWDTLLLSESVSFSLLALLLAAWLRLVDAPSRRTGAAVLALSLLWSFARDTNAYVVLMTGVFAAAALVLPRDRALKAALALGCAGIFALTTLSANAGGRWRQPMVDVVAHRVLPNPSLRTYFERHGLDTAGNWPTSEWIDRDARRTYAGYLLAHPLYTLAAPFRGHQEALYSTGRNAASLIDPSMKLYDDNADRRPLSPPAALRRTFFPRGVDLMIALVAAALALAAVVALRERAPLAWLVPIGGLATVYPQFLLDWHMSGVEVDRHALTAALLLRLCSLLLILFAIDRAPARSASRAVEVAAPAT